MRTLLFGYLFLAIFGFSALATWNPPDYKQCDSRWSQEILGFGPATICQAGCLMSSVTAMMAGDGVLLNNEYPTPEITNNWLKANGGFHEGDNFLWHSIEPLGYQLLGFLINAGEIIDAFEQGLHVILNVHEGHHYVLVTGISETGFFVMDPGYAVTEYLFQDFGGAAVYLRTPKTPKTIEA